MLSTANQRWMAACGIVSMLILLVGLWLIAGFVPPPSPNLSFEEIATIYSENQLPIIIGLIISLYGSTLIMPWVVAISMQMRRIESAPYPMSWLQLSLGVMLVLEFLFATIFWLAAAYRPMENIEITARFHDIGGIMYVGMPMTTMLEAVVFGMVILQDKRENPVFPRWLAYLSFWAAFSFVFGSLNYLMHSGPIAYDGLLAWWLGLVVFTIWMAAVTISLLRDAIPGQERENKGTIYE